jgi:hypothetical protein
MGVQVPPFALLIILRSWNCKSQAGRSREVDLPRNPSRNSATLATDSSLTSVDALRIAAHAWNIMSHRPHALKAHVENGRIVADEPLDLPDGTLLHVVPIQKLDEEMTDEERAELKQAIEEGYEDFERGDYEDANALAARLLAKP